MGQISQAAALLIRSALGSKSRTAIKVLSDIRAMSPSDRVVLFDVLTDYYCRGRGRSVQPPGTCKRCAEEVNA